MPKQIPLLIFLTLLSLGIPTVKVDLSDREPWIPTIASEFTLSTIHLRSLALCEPLIVESLEQSTKDVAFNTTNEWLLVPIQRYLKDYSQSSGRVNGTKTETVEKIISHPLLTFRMVYRFVFDIARFKSGEGIIGLEQLEKLVECEWPSNDDLGEAIKGLLRLSFIFDLELDELARGNIHGIETGFGLEPRHAVAIGKYALEMEVGKYHALTVEWLELAKALLNKDAGGTTGSDNVGVDPVDLDDMILLAVTKHDEEFKLMDGYANTFFTYTIVPRPEYPYEFDGFLGRYKQRTKDVELWGGESGPNFREINYWALCAGEIQAKQNSQLDCWYGKEGSWAINPLEIEELAMNPDLIQIYNVVTPAAADRIIATAEPFMSPSLVVDINDKSKTMKAARIQRIVQLMTGLNTVEKGASETLQVASYVSLGSHYAYHLDAYQESQIDVYGDRIATFMIYLTDAELGHGGQTAFVDAQVTARPVKGSAVFWYNLDTAGDVDYDTHHGACPILLGTKWVANKWIRYNSQFDVRKCPAEDTRKSKKN